MTIRLPNCAGCDREVDDATPDQITLHLGGPEGDRYRWTCPWCGHLNIREAHERNIGLLKAVGVRSIDPADQLAIDLENDDDIVAEMDGWK